MHEKISGFVTEPEGVAKLQSYGIPYPEHGLACSAEEAVSLAEKIGYPVVLKIVSADAPHKSDVGGVRVNLTDSDQVVSAYVKIIDSVRSSIPSASIDGVLVCQQYPEGVEVIIGASRDPIFGMIMMFGMGGIFAEILKDISFRAVPLQRIDAEEMISEIKGYPLLTGARGHAPCNLELLADFLVSVSKFIVENEQVKELDLNPVRVYPEELLALDVRIIEA